MRMSQLISAMAMSAVFVSLSANASLENEITIVNNFDHSLSYTIGINPELLPDLPVNFTLDTNGQAHSKFSDLKKEAYIRVEDGSGYSAFWGVELVDNKVIFHGYIDKGIAYSWNSNTIVFCTPDEYKKKRSCL